MPEQHYFKTANDWRDWLQKNHTSATEVWVIFYKKHTGVPCPSYNESVEEALCFGWVDNLIKSLDEERYMRRFMPRKDNLKWSQLNISRMQKLKKEGRLEEAGLRTFSEAVEPLLQPAKRSLQIPGYIEEQLTLHPKAMQFFETLSPSARRNTLHWIDSAKRESTRMRRLSQAIDLFKQGRGIGMK